MTTICRRCGATKDAALFRRNARTHDGLSSWCGACHNAAKRSYRRKQRAEARLDEAAQFERLAHAATGGRADGLRATASALRREAERELEEDG